MKTKINRLMIFAAAFVFAAALNVSVFGQDSSLNGTWVNDVGGDVTELTLQNGTWEQSTTRTEQGLRLFSKGTYTTTDGRLNMLVTDVMGVGSNFRAMGFVESRWYPLNDFVTIFRKFLANEVPENIANEIITLMVTPVQGAYSIVSNSLTVTIVYRGETLEVVYTRK